MLLTGIKATPARSF